nr:hypothetical protein [Halioglobus sp.]
WAPLLSVDRIYYRGLKPHAIQIGFCAMVLAAQVYPVIPQAAITAGSAAVLFLAGASGCDYVLKWSAKALQQRRKPA